jgi:prepilin peptidase CpaA
VITLAVASIGIVFAIFHVTSISLTAALAGFAVGLALMMPGHLLGATGAGDVKLFAAIGTLLGPMHMLTAFAYTAICGGALAIFVAVRRGRLEQTLQDTATFVTSAGANIHQIERPTANNRFAYAPAIAVGTLVAALGF